MKEQEEKDTSEDKKQRIQKLKAMQANARQLKAGNGNRIQGPVLKMKK